jgi:eukaryotic-like serine/threonine-protein kinase
MAEGGQAASKVAGVDPLIGRTINDRFKIIALIARGGMGKVYRAEQAPLGRLCALKVLNPNYAGEQDPEFHKRFFLEASVASKLTHPNTVTIFDYGQTEDNIYYMAMELLDGITLHRAIREAGSFPEERVAHIGRQICRALREAHALGVIHRDLKPANIFLVEHGDESDFVKVLDFGLVKSVVDPKPEDQLTQTGLFMGSPKYMSPEQIRGDRIDARTDVYSLGILMYEMLTGKPPFDRPNSLNILMAQVNEDAPPLSMMNPKARFSPVMEELVSRCMSKDPENRAASMDEVLATLKQIGGPLSMTGTGEIRSSLANSSGQHALSAAASGSMPVITGKHGFRSSYPPSTDLGYPPSDVPPTILGASAVAVGSSGNASAVSSSQQVALPLVNRSEPSATPPPIVMPELRRGRKALVALAACAAAVAAVLLVVLRPGGDADSAAPAKVADPARVAPPPASAAPVSVPVTTLPSASPTALATHLTSDPVGAAVKEDGKEICPSTPCDHSFEPDPAHEHKLVFSKQGFRAETKVIHAGETSVAVHLVAARAWSPPAQAKPAETGVATPQGFKEIPY